MTTIHTVEEGAYQGDLMIERIHAVPLGLSAQAPDADGGHIVAHSETGHHHRAVQRAATDGGEPQSTVAYLRRMSNDEGLEAYLNVGPGLGVDLVHERAWDTHATLHLPPGLYHLRRQVESTPDGWRRVED